MISPSFYENVILKFLLHDKDIRDKILPYLSPSVFDGFEQKEIVKYMLKFIEEHKNFPTISELKICIDKKEVFDKIDEIINLDISEYRNEFLLTEIETFFRKKLIWNVIADSAEELKSDKLDDIKSSPDKMREALSFSFDTHIGLDFMSDQDRIYQYLHNKDKCISTGLPFFDKLIDGGFHEKSLSVFMGESNIGKTAVLCSLAENILLQNKNVLYITMEMSEDKISQRILTNLFDMKKEDIVGLSKTDFDTKFGSIKKLVANRLVIKEYPTSMANTNHFRNLLKELYLKKGFTPDIIFVDYLGIMRPIAHAKDANTSSIGKIVSEELRGLGVETTIPMVTAVQTNRKGFSSANLDLTDMSESLGPAMTSDLVVGITQSEEFRKAGKFTFIILKNRYGINKIKSYVNIDYDKMRIWEDPKEEFANHQLNKTDIVDDAAVEVIKKLNNEKTEKQRKIIDFK